LAPWLPDSELEELVEASKTMNKRWSHDHPCATATLTVSDSSAATMI
jgi:hypothetical protein